MCITKRQAFLQCLYKTFYFLFVSHTTNMFSIHKHVKATSVTSNTFNYNNKVNTQCTLRDFADSAMIPRLIVRHSGQTSRLSSRENASHHSFALLILLIKCCVAWGLNHGTDNNLVTVKLFTPRRKMIAGRGASIKSVCFYSKQTILRNFIR